MYKVRPKKLWIVLCAISILVIGYFLGQIPMLGNRSEKLKQIEEQFVSEIEMAESYSLVKENGGVLMDMNLIALERFDSAISSLSNEYKSKNLNISKEDKTMLLNFLVHHRIVLSDLFIIEDKFSSDEFSSSEAFKLADKLVEFRNKRKTIYVEKTQGKNVTSELKLKMLIDELKTPYAKNLIAEMEEYCGNRQTIIEYRICSLHDRRAVENLPPIPTYR